MSEYFSNKIDFIIMIILALLVAFIIGFNILQIIDSKLSSVTINVPSSNCSLPPIYLNIDKDSNIKQIKLNDVINNVSNESTMNKEEFTNLDIEEFTNLDIEEFTNLDKIENYGNLQDYPLLYDNNRKHLISNTINSNKGNQIIDQKTIYETAKDPNYNTVNNLPLLFNPDTNVPNRAGIYASPKSYFASKVKLIEDPNSPLMKLAKENANKINNVVSKCTLNEKNKVPEVNGTFDGYNSFVDLRSDSYANITSIGKSMLSPYVSFPVPS
jgi:hypothetical protein